MGRYGGPSGTLQGSTGALWGSYGALWALWGLNGGPLGSYGGAMRLYHRQKSCFFIIFYTILRHFTEKSIKCTFWSGFLPLQGTPTGENNEFL